MLHCSFSLAAAQLLVKMTSALQKSQCCSATFAAQHSKNCSATSVFACDMLQGWGLEGWGLGLADVPRFCLKLKKRDARLQREIGNHQPKKSKEWSAAERDQNEISIACFEAIEGQARVAFQDAQ